MTRHRFILRKTTDPRAGLRCGVSGGVALWVLLSLVLLVVLAAFAWWGSGRRVGDTADQGRLPAMDIEAVSQELAQIGDLFSEAMEHGRDVRKLIDQVNALVQVYPDMASAHTLLGQMLISSGRGEESLSAFQASLKIDPRQAGVEMLAGTIAVKLGRLEVAQHHYEQALSIEPNNGRYAVSLAMVQLKLGQEDQAVQTLLSAIRRDSNLHRAYMVLSDIYAHQNKIGLAMSPIERAIELVPADNPQLRVTYVLKRAALLRRNNQPAESLATLLALPGDAQLRPIVMRDTATSWRMLGKPAMAAQMYEQALRLDPSSDLAAAGAARWRIKTGDIETARKHVEALRRINPRYEALTGLDEALRDAAVTVEP